MADTRPTDGTCSRWVGDRYCREVGGVRYFVNGFRCGEHGPTPTPAAVAGRGEVVAGPGAGRYRREGER